MPQNIEIKARTGNIASVGKRLTSLGARYEVTLHQHDTFFHVPSGRLKLRRFQDRQAELLFYHRPDESGPTRSEYRRLPLDDPDYYQELLSAAFGTRGVVEKTRHLYHLGQTRIHLDTVNHLGEFVELEVVLDLTQTMQDGHTIAKDLMESLGIRKNELVDAAYIDLLEQIRSP